MFLVILAVQSECENCFTRRAEITCQLQRAVLSAESATAEFGLQINRTIIMKRSNFDSLYFIFSISFFSSYVLLNHNYRLCVSFAQSMLHYARDLRYSIRAGIWSMVKNSTDRVAMTHIAGFISLALPSTVFIKVNETNPKASPVLIL